LNKLFLIQALNNIELSKCCTIISSILLFLFSISIGFINARLFTLGETVLFVSRLLRVGYILDFVWVILEYELLGLDISASDLRVGKVPF
jgi:hypothetical protein